jgi:hypothetical protein
MANNFHPKEVTHKPRTMMTGEHSWARSHGTYISGRAYLDGADETAVEMEAKWGVDRLRLLVSSELREKFDRQRYLLNQAIWHGELEDVRRESGRMVVAWQALNRAAEAAGKQPLAPAVWEVALADGSVAAIVPDNARAALVNAEGRQVAVYTLDEIARLLSNYSDIAKAKLVFPGATITEIRPRFVEDPLNAIWDTDGALDDPIGDVGS